MTQRYRPNTILIVASLLVVLAATTVKSQDASRPNIVLILADDLGYGDLSSYGAQDLRSPHVDGLVARGMRFDHFYANSSVCSPTRAALLSGRYQALVGVPGVVRTHPENSWGYLTRSSVMLPRVLREAGYSTAMVGKWHLGLEAPNRPIDRGFDHFRGFLGDMMDDYYKHRRHGINYMRAGAEEIDPEGHATDLFSTWAAEYVATRRDQQQPFFLYLAYNAPHTPIQPPADWLARVQEREPEMSEKRARLVALIEHMDHGIGQVLKALDDAGHTDDTLVVFSSDNGGQLNVGANNGNLRDGKQSMYEGGLRVPTVVTWPKRVAAGSRSDRVLLSMDIFPTLVEAAGGELSTNLDGRSFLDALDGEANDAPPRDLFFDRREGGLRYGGQTIFAMRRGPWKLLQNSPWEPLQLYNLESDPEETRDLSSRRPDIVKTLQAAVRRQVQRYGAVPWQRSE